ncbi:MAG: autotransporter assembly complex family protein [Pseudomonadota bacterium]
MQDETTRIGGIFARRVFSVSLLLGSTMVAGCAWVDELPVIGGNGGYDDVASDIGQTIPYDVTFTGIDPHEERLLASLRDISTSLRLRDRPTPTLAGLDRRAEDDVERFQSVLRSFGFYDGVIGFDVRPVNETESEPENAFAPVILEYQIDTGAPYLLADVMLETIHPDGTETRPLNDAELEKAGLRIGMRAEADPVILAEQAMVDQTHRDAYPLARTGKRKVIANTEEKTLSVTYQVITDDKANFGAVNVVGATEVDPEFIAGYRSWRPGQAYSPDEISATRRDLTQSNLFNTVSVRPVGPVGDNGEIPVEIQVEERDHRTVGGGIDYSTADGPGANAYWEHRNLLGKGEKLRLTLRGSQHEHGLEAGFRKPQFLRRKQALVATSTAKQYSTDAYDGDLADAFVGVERSFAEHWSATVGVTAEYSDLTGIESPNEQFYLGGLRGILRRDSTDNLLDPTSGNRLELNVSPYTSLTETDMQFTSVSIGASQYFALDEDGYYVLAGRGRVGAIFGESRSDLPANKRFFAGGGGSVRGYEYQKLGPLNANGDPIGGRSVIETGLEFRARVTEDFGLVPFIEGGNVFDRSNPDDLDLLWAAGLGFRYYTAVGPVRFDVAVPLDKRDNVDDDFQIYISIGQAF